MKFPKTFRRRSSSNVLEDIPNPPQSNPPQSSFRVLERTSRDAKSASEGNLLSPKNADAQRRRSSQPFQEPPNNYLVEESRNPSAYNRYSLFSSGPLASIRKRLTKDSDSGGTVNSNVTAGTYDTSPSLRFSSSSASRPSYEMTTPDQPHPPRFYDKQPPSMAGALRNTGRTLSLNGQSSKQSGSSMPKPLATNRMTIAEPPQFLNSELDLGRDSGFENIFDNFGNTIHNDEDDSDDDNEQEEEEQHSPSEQTPPVAQMTGRQPRPAPINTDRSKEVEPSPYSWDSRHSEEGLLGSSNPNHYDSLAEQTSAMSLHDRYKPSTLETTPPATTSHRALERPKSGAADRGLRRSVIFSDRPKSTVVQDKDAQLIMDSLHSTKGESQQQQQPSRVGNSRYHEPEEEEDEDHEGEEERPLFDRGRSPEELSPRQQATKSPVSSEFEPDPTIADHARIASEFEHAQPARSPPPTTKVMTPLQFERYREQQEFRKSYSTVSKSEYSDDESDPEDYNDYDDEDDKDREAEKQRQKQEANLAVYRQQMMKVTGQLQQGQQGGSTTSLRADMDTTTTGMMTPNPLSRSPYAPGTHVGSLKSTSDGDEDEEIPLGILAAHGFPNKTRPPTRLSSHSVSNLRPGSAAGSIYGPDHQPANASSQMNLPAFAKNLPRDPYYGASLVNPSNRESLAMGGGGAVGGGGPPSMHGNSAPHPSALPPGGLIGVIATEERARAIRRGSPHTQAMHGMHDHGMIPGTMPSHPSSGIPRPYSMAPLTPGTPFTPGQAPPMAAAAAAANPTATEQAQINLSQQMGQMMQMQMQWMQQMMQLQGGQSPMPMPMPQMPMGGAPFNAHGRTNSMMSTGAGNYSPAPGSPAVVPRTYSMTQDPMMAARMNGPPGQPYASGGIRPGTPGGQGYAPSIAPSERSTIGAAPRYRPVTVVPPVEQPIEQIPIPKPWAHDGHRSSISSAKGSTPTVTVRPISSGSLKGAAAAARPRTMPVSLDDDDDDDDEGWAEMMKKREDKKSTWKTSKRETDGASGLGDLVNVVH